jgi:alpha-galactosidase
MVMPPEVLGSHVGPSPAHNTGRRLPMAFRTAVAMFGHMGIEADVTRLDERERAVLRHGVELYKTWREFVHHGRFVRFDRGPDAVCFGVLSDDASQLLVCHVQIAAPSVGERSTNWRFPGLDPERNHRVRVVPLVPDSTTIASDGAARRQPDWWSAASSDEPPVVSGAVLREIGLAAPLLAPQRAVVLHLSGS